MGIKQALKRGRRLDEAIMTDTCEITRPTGAHHTDPETGEVVEAREPVYSGPCRLTSAPDTGRPIHSGEYSYFTESPRLHLPHGVQVRPGDEAIITETSTDTVGVGDRMRLLDLSRGTFRTSQRWNVEVYT